MGRCRSEVFYSLRRIYFSRTCATWCLLSIFFFAFFQKQIPRERVGACFMLFFVFFQNQDLERMFYDKGVHEKAPRCFPVLLHLKKCRSCSPIALFLKKTPKVNKFSCGGAKTVLFFCDKTFGVVVLDHFRGRIFTNKSF